MKKNKLLPNFFLLLFTLLLILHHAYSFLGHYGFDDLHYAQLAKALLQGKLDFSDHYSYRFAVLVPIALCYGLFGVSDWASALPALVAAGLVLWLVLRALRQESPWVILIGLGLTACSNWFLFYSDKLMPDIQVALALMLAVFVVDRYKYHSDHSRPQVHALGLVLALAWGFLAKETIVLSLPMLFYWFVVDLRKRQHGRFWRYSILFGIGFLVLYFSLIGFWTGNAWARLQAIADNSYLNACSYDQQSWAILLRRLYRDFFALAGTELLLFNLVFVLAYVFRRGILKVFALSDSSNFYASSAILLFLASNFMSISLKAYVPMCLDARHYLFLIPVAAVPAARVLGEFLEQKKYALPLMVFLALASAWVFSISQQLFEKPYLPSLLLLGVYFVLPKVNAFAKTFFSLCFLGILLIGPIQQWQYAHKVAYRSQKVVTQQFFIHNNEPAYVITDEVQKRLGNYYNGFNTNAASQFLSFNQFNFDTLDGRKTYLYLNWYTQFLSGLSNGDLPDYARNLDTTLNPKLYQNPTLNIAIYELKVPPQAKKLGSNLLHSQNDFEKKYPHWDQVETQIESNSPHRGKAAYRFSEYSATFNFPLDELKKSPETGLRIQAKVYLKIPTANKAKLVISLENAEGAYLWQAQDLNKFLKLYGQWLPVEYTLDVPKTGLKPNSRLKIYVWNEDKTELWMDDFEVNLWALGTMKK